MAMCHGGNPQLDSRDGPLNSMLISLASMKFSHMQLQQQMVSTSSSGRSSNENALGNASGMRASIGNPVAEFTSAVQALLNSTVFTFSAAGSQHPIQNESGNEQQASSWIVKNAGEAVLRVLEDGLGLDVRHPSPVTKSLPMVRSPGPVVACILLYVAATWLWTAHIRRSGLKPRKEDPLPLRCVVVVHNLFLCCLSALMAHGLLASAQHLGYSVWGNHYRGDETEMGMYIYMFYVSKLYEFMDTAIMLFRRNLRQITFLHVYHHATITFIWWIICYTSPGADAYFSAAFNSCVHVVMYLYYLLAATIAKDESRRRKYLFWGKYLTMLQMAQFLSFIMQSIYAMWKPELYPRGIPRLLFVYSTSLLACFGNFFVKKYNGRRRPRPQDRPEKKMD